MIEKNLFFFRTDFRDLLLWYSTHQFSALMFFFCWVVFISLYFGGRTNLAWSVCLSGKLACFEVQFKNLTSFSPPTHFFLFVKFSMSKKRLKPPETAWKNFQAVKSELKWSQAIWSVLKHFSGVLDFTLPFSSVTSLPFEFHHLFKSTFFWWNSLCQKTASNRLKPLERTFKRSKANWRGRKRFEVF